MNPMYAVFFLGPPGSGKGTQARLLARALQCPSVGMGDLLREEIKKKTQKGRDVQSFVDVGDVPPWEIVREIFQGYVEHLQDSIVIFDGIPRSTLQVEDVEQILAKQRRMVLQAIFLHVPSEDLFLRMMQRCQCADCGMSHTKGLDLACTFCGCKKFFHRPDDQEEIVYKRIEIYNATLEPLIHHYEYRKLLMMVDGKLPVSEVQHFVFQQIVKLMERSALHVK